MTPPNRDKLLVAITRAIVATAFSVLGLVSGCESDHDALALRPGSGGVSGKAGSAGRDAAVEAGGTGGSSGTGSGIAEAGGDADSGPLGPNELTFVHGIADAQRIALCFAKVVGGSRQAPLGDPIPAGGLAFGHPLDLTTIAGFDFATDDILPIVITGDLTRTEGLDCNAAIALARSFGSSGGSLADTADALRVDDATSEPVPDVASSDAAQGGNGSATDAAAGDSSAQSETGAGVDASEDAGGLAPLRTAELSVLPAGSLTEGRSSLLVAAGCIGGSGYEDPSQSWVCGADYRPTNPTLTAVLVAMSRQTLAGHLGLQVVHAAFGGGAIDLTSQAPAEAGAAPITIASHVVLGAIAPNPPNLTQSKFEYGNPLGASELDLLHAGGSSAALSLRWADALALGGLSDVEDGRTYAIVIVGPPAGIAAGPWWNAPSLTIVPTGP